MGIIAPPYLAAAGEAPVRGDVGMVAREKHERHLQARAQRAVVSRFVRDNPGRTFGIVAVLGLMAGLIVLRR